MLQPRLFGCTLTMGSFGWLVCVAVISSALVSCQETNNESIEATRIKRESVSENRDLTVLLVNDQQRTDLNSKTGRYHSVKPLIGLLTSTARTFIQDGVTTEFATQILGTTLNNGRIYAQLLTKSSLVLYSKPNNDDAVAVKPTRVHSAFDGQWSVKQDLGFIDPDKFALKNTDYLAPNSKMEIVYPSKPAQEVKFWNPNPEQDNQVLEEPTARRVQPNNEVPRYVQNEAYNFLDGPTVETEKKYEFVVKPAILENINALHRQSKAFEPVTEPIKVDSRIKEEINESNIVKVKPNYDLPTFTIKNEFSPIFYYIDNVESRSTPQSSGHQTKLPKRLFGQKSEPRPKKTFTYAGFADFTTIVGDTVIVFTPNTDISRPQSPDKVNVFPSAKHADKLKVTFLAADIPVATATYKPYEDNAASKTTTSSSENNSGNILYNSDESLKKVHYDIDDKMQDVISVQHNNGFDFNLDVIQPSEAAVTTTESTRLTDNLGVIPVQEYNSQATDPLTTLKPSATIVEEPKESAITESSVGEDFVTSEEEADNTASEVTEKTEEEDEEEEDDEEEEVIIPEEESGIASTTESGHSDESFEDTETTTETKLDIEEKPICGSGLETQSTMTTAYKTLTYLTTYFIPLESSVTTTSVKSNVVVESNVGFLTNLLCKSNVIEPTAVYKINVQSSVHSSLESPDVDTEESIVSPPTQPADVVTESVPKDPADEEEILTPVVPKQEIGTTVGDSFNEDVKSIKVNETTNANIDKTTTDRVTTSQNHVEVSVSTEHATTPTEKPSSDEEEDSKENEIDLIYKTLYTTYTYFTTFFGDQTSSVASHKSVVTNIITSTVNLANLDPSLLGAFDEDEIAPTSVGIGRPTESFAINSIIDLVKNKDVLESVQIGERYSSQTPTPSLGDDVATINPDSVKTYFTTYTFFTTIYVGTDANICSRSEVYTNYVGPEELIPTKTNPLGADKTKAQFDFRNCKQTKREPTVNPEETSSMESSVSMEENDDELKDDNTETSPQPSPVEVDMLFSVESNPVDTESSYVTDVKSSSSRGERQYIENNYVLDDQISSESNIEEIMPSPTLLLQTSYTTFTYFTTMYIGKDSSKVKSRLETITNVVTETIIPKKELAEESNLPITYYTTFTYWTTLVKDKITTITSREEIVSNIVTPVIQVAPTISPIDTTPIEIESVLAPKELEAEIKPSLINDTPEQDDGKATFYTTYTYFTTFYAGNSSQIRSSLETVTNIVDNTKVVEDNQLGRKVGTGAVDKNLIQDNGEKPHISPTVVKEEIKPTHLPDLSAASPTILAGTYIDNLFEIKSADSNTPAPDTDKKIIFSQVAVIAGNSVVVTNDNKTLSTESTTTDTVLNGTTTQSTIISPTPDVIESSVAEPGTTTDATHESDDDEEEDDGINSRKKSRLTFTTKKPSFTPVIIPFASRNRPTFSPKRVPSLSSATTITRADSTPTITATPTLKSVRSSGFGGNRKASSLGILSSSTKRFSGRSSISNPSANVPSASRSGGFGNRPSIQPTSRRTGFRSSSIRSNNLDYASRSAVPRIRPTASSRLRGNRQSASIALPPLDQNESETSGTQQEENVTEPLNEVTEAPIRTTNNPLLRFRRPPVARQPGTAITPRVTTPATRRTTSRGRLTTTTRRPTTRSTTNPLLSLRRQRPNNSLFPRRNLFKQPDPEPEEEIKENEQEVEESEEILEGEEFEDNDYESSDRKEQQVSTPSTSAPKRNVVQIRPFAFRRRTKRQVDYGNRKYSNFRRPGLKSTIIKAAETEPETEAPAPVTQKTRPGSRFNSRLSSQSRTTTSAPQKSSQRQPFIVRGESRTTASHRQTTTSSPAYRRSKSKASSRTTTIASRPKAPKLLNRNSQSDRSRGSSRSSTSRSRTRTTTSRGSSRQRNSFENYSGERQNYKNVVDNGKITVTYQIPTEVTIPVVNGKITEYKNVLTAKPSIEVLLRNQVATTLGPLGNQQLVLASDSTKLAENGATEIIKFHLHETPTTTVIFTPTTIRGRKTSYSHVLPSTVYNVEPVTQTIAPEINANVPLANLLLSQLLLGNQQPAINPLLALQGQGLLPQQQLVQTPVTEYKTRTTTYVTTVTDARETVLPITFKGKAILTTIVDPTTNVITATEFVTDTIVTTPTALAPHPQFNSLLLPLLLQQQQQQQQQQTLQTPNPLLGLGQADVNLLHNNDIYSNSPKPNILPDLNGNEDFSEESEDVEEDAPPPPPPIRTRNKPRAPKPAPPKLTSVVTMYVSGRYPGEFSTVLSTVVVDDTQVVRKREAIYYNDIKVLPSILPSVSQLISSQSDNELDNLIVAGTEKYIDDSSHKSQEETQSLESIVGSLSEHIRYDASPTYVVKLATATAIRDFDLSSVDDVSCFNTNGIVYDNSPWRPGRDIDLVDQGSTEDERRFKNLATKVLSNGVEVLVKDKNDGKQEQRKLKLMQVTSFKPPFHHISSPSKSLLSSAVATFFNHQQMSAIFPLHQLMQHNYIIKTCMTTYTYLTTVVQNKRSDISTFETIVSVVTTESLTNLPLYATDIFPDIKPTNTKYMDVKTIKPSSPSKIYQSHFVKFDKRIDNDNENSFDLIQPSEAGGHTSCTGSCSCSHAKTESLKTKYSNVNDASAPPKYAPMKTSKYDSSKLDLKPTNKESYATTSKYNPYEYESGSQLAPTDKVVEKYTEVMNDYSDEKDSNSVEESELLTNEQAPGPPKPSKIPVTKSPEKQKPEKPQKPNKNKNVVADLLKLGSLGIKGLSQLAPVLEKMTGGLIKRQENRSTTTTIKPVSKLTAYSVDKRIDTDVDMKSNFPIYIPVDELETSETQIAFTNATLHQNLAWAAEHKQPKRIVPPKMIHESPLVNGGIPISPGEIITANSDVIVGRPAVGGPLTLAASGIKLQNPVNPPVLDSLVAGGEQYFAEEKPPVDKPLVIPTEVDDSFDLRPPELPKTNNKPIRNLPRPTSPPFNYYNSPPPKNSPRPPLSHVNDHVMKTEKVKPSTTILSNHGRPAFLDYIPSLAPKRPEKRPQDSDEIPDNSPSSSEVISTRVRIEDSYPSPDHNVLMSKPFLIDIQPSRVANVLIPHGSSTALVFAGSSEPHKTGDYVDDPLPYPEPGYFGSFSIDAPQMTNVHNAAPNNIKQFSAKPTHRPLEPYKPNPPVYKNNTFKNDHKIKWKDSKSSYDYSNIPPPTSNQETFLQVGPHITAYNPNIYHHSNGDFEKYSHMRGKEKQKEVIDNEYENYLAVPPPPPQMQFNRDTHFDKNKPYSQKPIVHTKPIQDMKVFLNIQHPVPKLPQKDQLPPKITSEIYYAAQVPSSKPTPVYTVHIPPAGPTYGNSLNQAQNQQPYSDTKGSLGHVYGSVSAILPPTYNNKSITNKGQDKDGTYTVTLNTATNVASNVGDAGQVIGSSVPVSVGSASKYGDMNTNIPISTNFAIRVEDDATHLETYNINSNHKPSITYNHVGSLDNLDHTPVKVSMGDNRWNGSSFNKNEPVNKNKQNDYYYDHKENNTAPIPSIAPSLNSHANFPMMKDSTTPSSEHSNIKPVTEYMDDIKSNDQKRPAKLIPNIPTNSHGWYSSIPINENTFNSITNLKVDPTTRKAIPLHDYNKESLPHFGQKVTSAGKPPTEFWGSDQSSIFTHHGKPFTKPHEPQISYSSHPPMLSRPYSPNYIPSNLGAAKQPAYDIPIRDNSDETTTVKYTGPTSEKSKPVYENSEEIYDGEESDSSSELEGEVSQESMKIPVVSTSSEIEHTSKSTTQIVLLQDEVIPNIVQRQKDKNVNLVDFDPGTQTEKPFGSFNKTVFSSNTIKPIYDRNPYMNPRPFTADNVSTLDHQLHQPHWQINEMLENSTNISYEENLELNTGEEMSTVSTHRPSTTRKSPYHRPEPDKKYQRPQRPVFSVRPNNTAQSHDPNIITSTVQIQDKKPLVIDKANEKTTIPTFTITTNLNVNRTSSEIIDLSPPPPTMDYNFKPSTNDEMIMGMSPPPPRTPPAIRPPSRTTPRPIRTPHPYRTSPPRTLSPRVTTQRPTRKPITRDEVSTYRPAYDTLNNIKRPVFNRGQPSSQLVPPPKEPTRVTSVNEAATERPTPSNVIFPTPVSSGWLTSSGVEFNSGFEFEPTSIQFTEIVKPSKVPQLHEVSPTESTSESSHESSGDRIDNVSSEKPVIDDITSDSSKESTDQKTSFTIKESSTESVSKESQEDVSTERIKYATGNYRNRTRKPYPSRENTNRYKVTTRPTSTTKPIRMRPEILYPTRPTPTKKIPQIRPVPQRPSIISPSSIIESSETPVEENFVKPTDVLKDTSLPSVSQLDASSVIERIPQSIFGTEIGIVVKPTHHAGNEVKVFDEIIPTKTELKTTVITFTKTLSDPPQIVSSFVNLTHTLTVTHTETSLVSKSEGAVTETLILTNTHTSTVVDVVTEVYTQVLPTTIIETVTKHIPIRLDPTHVVETTTKTKQPLDDVTISSEESDNFIIKDSETTENIQKIQTDSDNENDTFFVVMNKSQNGGQTPPVQTDLETGDYDGVTRNEQVNSNGVSQVLFGEILLAGTPYLETTNVGHPTGTGYGKECQPDCKASRNERCQRIDGLMKCVCRPGFARMFPDRPCKPTYTYSVKLALGSQGNDRLHFHESLADNSSKQYQALAFATHEGINRMVMQSDLRDVFHGVHITGFHPVEMRSNGELFQGVMNDFYVQLSDNAHESRLKEVLEKYLRHNNYSLGGTDVHAAGEMVDRLEVNDFDECLSGQFHDCSEHSQCFNLRGTYTCSCLEGFADLSVNPLYPGRICSAEPVGCERCNYHGACYSRDDRRVLCECFQWYAGSTCHINLKVVLISLVVVGALLTAVLAACAVVACSRRPRPPPRSIVACIQGMPGLPQGAMPSKQRADRRALINERADSGDASSVQNASLPYMPAKRPPGKKCVVTPAPAHDPPPVPAPAVMIPRARLHPHPSDSRENISRKKSLELCNEAKLISYLESGAANPSSNDEMRRKHSMESSYSAMKERHNKQGKTKVQGALVSAGFKVSTTVRPDDPTTNDRDDLSSVHKDDMRFDSLRKSYSQEDLSEWTDAERRLGELTLSEARSVGGTLPASTGRAASSTRLTHQEANTMAERDLGSTFLLPHVHLYKPDLTSDISEFDSL